MSANGSPEREGTGGVKRPLPISPAPPTSGTDSKSQQDYSDDENGRRRHRRKFAELSRDYICPVGDCRRPYASNHSLKLHMRLKHMKMVMGNKIVAVPRQAGPVYPLARPPATPNGSLAPPDGSEGRNRTPNSLKHSPEMSSEDDYAALIPASPKEFENMSNEDLFGLEARLSAEDGQLAADLEDISTQLAYYKQQENNSNTQAQVQHLQTSRDQIWERKVALERTLARLSDTFNARRSQLPPSPHPGGPHLTAPAMGPPHTPHGRHPSPLIPPPLHPPGSGGHLSSPYGPPSAHSYPSPHITGPAYSPHMPPPSIHHSPYSPAPHLYPHASPSTRFPMPPVSPGIQGPYGDHERRWSESEAVKPAPNSRLAILPDFVAQSSPVPPEDWTAYCDLTQRHSQLQTTQNHAGYRSQRDMVKKFADFCQAEGITGVPRTQTATQEARHAASLDQELQEMEMEGLEALRATGTLPPDYMERYTSKLSEAAEAAQAALGRAHSLQKKLMGKQEGLRRVVTDRRGVVAKPDGTYSLVGAPREEISGRMQTAIQQAGVIMEEADSALTQAKLDRLNDNHAEIINMARILSHKLRDQITLLQTALQDGDRSIARLSECYHEALLLVDVEMHSVGSDLTFVDAEEGRVKRIADHVKRKEIASKQRDTVLKRLTEAELEEQRLREEVEEMGRAGEDGERLTEKRGELQMVGEAYRQALLDAAGLSKDGQVDVLTVPAVREGILTHREMFANDPFVRDHVLAPTRHNRVDENGDEQMVAGEPAE